MLMFTSKALSDFEGAISKEWITTNGLGGYASSTILGINTRRYHALLVAPTETPPFGRKLLLSKLEEEVQTRAEVFHLSVNEYPNVVYPAGHKYLKQFRVEPLPTFNYSLLNFLIKKTIFMPYGTNAVVVNYKVWNPSELPVKITIRPLVNSRSIHKLTKAGSLRFEQHACERQTDVAANYRNAPTLTMGSDLLDYVPSELPEEARWYKNMVYREEKKRGYEFTEDNYCPGRFELELKEQNSEFSLFAAGGSKAREHVQLLSSRGTEGLEKMRIEAIERLDGLVKGSLIPEVDPWEHLVWTADSFIADGKIIAGYHWFGCWGRDSLISIPGLTLVTRRFDVARQVLLELVERRSGGLIPNCFENGARDYDCADASLLLFYALHKYLTYTDDVALAEKIWDSLEEILDFYLNSDDKSIKVCEDGLVWSDKSTWMDAKIEDKRVTPRQGKAVEINALWYNALRTMESIAKMTGRKLEHAGLADRVRRNFLSEFWNGRKSCLYDVVGDGFRDQRVRPNQIFAVSLPFPVIEGRRAEEIVSVVRNKLLTPYGLRSLEREDSDYKGVYDGNVVERDMAYHQGTVWGWLIGPFITAFLRVNKGENARELARGFLEKLVGDHLMEAGVGTISEIFDGDAPHKPRGCISQAWSVAEILRCYVEDVRGRRPPFEGKYGNIS